MRLTWVRRGSDDLRFAFDRYQVGGVRRSVLPAWPTATRVEVPALAEGALVGDAVESQRFELSGRAPAGAAAGQRAARSGSATGPGTRGDRGATGCTLAGVELTRTLQPVPLLGLPGAHVTAGAAYLLDTPGGADDGDFWAAVWAAVSWLP